MKLKCRTCGKEYKPRFFDPKYVSAGFCSEECLPDRSYLIIPKEIPKAERLTFKLVLEFIKQEVNSNRNKVYKTYVDVYKTVLSKEFVKAIAFAIAYFLFLIYVLSGVLNSFGFEHLIVVVSAYFIVSLGGIINVIGAGVKELEKFNSRKVKDRKDTVQEIVQQGQ